MRSRGLEAAFAAAIWIGSGLDAARADDFFADLDKTTAPSRSAALERRSSDPGGLLEQPTARPAPTPVGGLTMLEPEDWAPEHRPGYAPPRPLKKLAEPSVKASGSAAKVDDKAIGLDPEDAVKAPAATPSRDPLDAKRTGSTPAAAGQQVGDALPPLGAAIKAALDKRAAVDIRGPQAPERRKERDAIAFFYAAHGFEPLWSEGGKPVAAAGPVLGRLGRAADDALTLPMPPVGLAVQGTPPEVAESDIALTEAVVSYARQATGSRVDPVTISPLIGARPELVDPGEVLDMLASAGTAAGDRLQALNPPDPRYAALREKLIALHAAATPAAELPIPSGPTLRVGMRDPRVPLIRSRFSLDMTSGNDPAELEYDTQVAEAVAGFQKANGLPPSGALNKRTLAALSGDEPPHPEVAVAANMEMWRWLPRDLGNDRIEVNVPEFMVTVFHEGQPVARNRVVVGKTATPTPLFSNTMKYLIVNPVWNVPDSIIKKEFLPKSGDDPSYLADHGFDVSYDHGRLVVKQPSGAKNALGRIKFIFPNAYSVYLHDTPSKSLFAAAKRAFSHGCVRVDQPFDFAQTVLNDSVPEGGKMLWTKARLESMLGDKERYVRLPEPLRIHIEYFTADVDPQSGRLELHDDIYDYTRKVAALLGQEG